MKVSVIGMGAVGTLIAGSLMPMAEVGEIVCVNRTREKAEGEVLDLLHTTSFTAARNPRLRAGDVADVAASDIVVVTAGAQIAPGERRDTLLAANERIVRALMPELERHAPGAIVLVVTNPVEAVTGLMLRHSAFPASRVISLGTVVDTARLMRIVGERVGIDPKNVFGYVLGDHSDTAFVAWSLCNVCGMEIDRFCALNDIAPIDREAVEREVVEAGLGILRRKGNTNHGIAASVCRIVRAIVADEKSVLPVGTMLCREEGLDDVVLSLPTVIGRGGAERVLRVAFTEGELASLHASARHVRELLR